MSKQKAQELKTQGKSVREIAQELKVSKSTIHRWTKQSPQPVATSSKLDSIHFLPPGGGLYSVPAVQQYTGIYRGGQNFYIPSDLAIITNRDNARRMWNNLTIRSALQERLWAAAEHPGHVEPQDRKDKRQIQVATQIQQVIEEIPDFLKLKYCLLKSRFFGCYGVMLRYQWYGKSLRVKSFIPVHGDSIIFKQDSDDIAVYTTIGGGPGTRRVTTEAGYIGRAHVVEDGREIHFDAQGQPYQNVSASERQAFILMTYDPDPSDFQNPRQAGGVKGLGLRSTIYPTWFLANEVLGNLMDFLERFGTGITMYKYLRGNTASYNEAVTLAQSQSNQAAVMVPVDPDKNGGKPLEGVERIEPSAVGLDNMIKVIEDIFNAQIRRFIVGQDSTSQAAKLGLGSKIASVHENTFARIVEFDCIDLQETLTRELVHVIQQWNHPEAGDFTCRYVIDFDKPDVEQQMKAIKDAFEMGIAFDEDEVRQLTGCKRPDLDAKVIQKTMSMSQPVPQPVSMALSMT